VRLVGLGHRESNPPGQIITLYILILTSMHEGYEVSSSILLSLVSCLFNDLFQ
jgi:hypothetical protein